MSGPIIKPTKPSATINPGPGALIKYLTANGKMPPVTLSIFPLEDLKQEYYIDKFMAYNFQSSILVPVDTFNCEIYYQKINGFRKPTEGDLCVLRSNGIPLATGIIDQTDMETESSGTRLSITGRDLLSQFEDQDAVSLDSKILWANKFTVDQVIQALAKDTRINAKNIIKRTAPTKPYLFATQPGESKLSALQRYCEALDIYFWMAGNGNIIVGKPDMYGLREGRKGVIAMKKSERRSNVLSIRSTRNSTSIPNMILPIWTGQETVQDRVTASQMMKNPSYGPARLFNLNHKTPKAVVVSTPEGAAPQDLAEVNTLIVAKQNADQQKLTRSGASTILQAYGKRAIARANMKELTVQATVAGHYNDQAEPYLPDTIYRVQYDQDDIDEDMFLYEVDYRFDDREGQRTTLFFCRQTALVSDVRAL